MTQPLHTRLAPQVQLVSDSLSVNLIILFSMVADELLVALNWTGPRLVDRRSNGDGDGETTSITARMERTEAVARDNTW